MGYTTEGRFVNSRLKIVGFCGQRREGSDGICEIPDLFS